MSDIDKRLRNLTLPSVWEHIFRDIFGVDDSQGNSVIFIYLWFLLALYVTSAHLSASTWSPLKHPPPKKLRLVAVWCCVAPLRARPENVDSAKFIDLGFPTTFCQ